MAKLQIFLPNGSEITHDLPEEKTSVGRIAENQLHIPEDSVSSQHAEILFENANFYVRDLNSTNGTFVNGSKTESAVLKHGDEVRFGSIACLFISENADSAVAPEAAAAEDQLPSTKSVRPQNFTSCSPIPRNTNGNDFSPRFVAWAALIGIAATAAALFFIFLL